MIKEWTGVPHSLQEFLHFCEPIFEAFYITASATDINTSYWRGERLLTLWEDRVSKEEDVRGTIGTTGINDNKP